MVFHTSQLCNDSSFQTPSFIYWSSFFNGVPIFIFITQIPRFIWIGCLAIVDYGIISLFSLLHAWLIAHDSTSCDNLARPLVYISSVEPLRCFAICVRIIPCRLFSFLLLLLFCSRFRFFFFCFSVLVLLNYWFHQGIL